MADKTLDDRMLDEATEWFVKMRAENPSDARITAFADWISQSNDHQAAYLEIGGLWDDLAVLEKKPTASVSALGDHRAPQGLPGVKPAANDLAPKKNVFWSLRLIAASIALLLVSVLGVQYGDHLWLDNHQTARGELADVILEDGSHLMLNTKSHVRVDLQADKRVVYLAEGEVYFEVAKDENRPFYVETSGGLVRVLGTKFNIRHRGDHSDVTVLEGAVGVVNHGRISDVDKIELPLDATLKPNEKFILGDDQADNVALPVDGSAVLSWRDRKLVYNGARFATLVEDLNRYYDAEIRIGDPALENIEVVAILQVEDRAATLKALEQTFHITAQPVSKDLIYLYPQK
ncbi:FecR family protein [Paremcibacter congregatus]|uniref:FecR family protein n=1 Tax=Paremcibacter congregatus TaxID=2043170 RepID=UPI0030ED81DF|tara:strand:+ start:8824 stop:9864 length:1041 start_codon:yes stop_codon:yes gene_type:complete